MDKILTEKEVMIKAVLFFLFATDHTSTDMENMIRDVLDILIKNKYIEEADGLYYMTKKAVKLCPELAEKETKEEGDENGEK